MRSAYDNLVAAAMLPMICLLATVQVLCLHMLSCPHSSMLPHLAACMSFSYQYAVVILHAVLRCVLPHVSTHYSTLLAGVGLRPLEEWVGPWPALIIAIREQGVLFATSEQVSLQHHEAWLLLR